MKRFTGICLALLLLWTLPVLANTAEQQGLLESAVAGDAQAQYELARIYEEEALDEGDILEPAAVPWEKALSWYEAAATQGHKQAQYCLLSRMYSHEVEEQESKWFRLANSMAEGGDKYAQYRLAGFFYTKCVGSHQYEGDPLSDAIHWHTALLKGTEGQRDDEDILPRSLTFSRKATIGDIKLRLNYLKGLIK